MAKQLVLKNLLFLILIFGYHMISVTGITQIQLSTMIAFKIIVIASGYFNAGRVTLSPAPVAPVCEVGDQLELTCNISGSYLRWILTMGNEQGMLQEHRRNINSQDGSQQISQVMVNFTTFTFMRTSSRDILPLDSTLVINSVSRDLNGVMVYCVDVNASRSVSTTIHLFDMGILCM